MGNKFVRGVSDSIDSSSVYMIYLLDYGANVLAGTSCVLSCET